MSTEKALTFARLVGSYHARRAAKDEGFVEWLDQLSPAERRQLMDYERVGVAMFEWPEFREEPKPVTIATALDGFRMGMGGLLAAAQQLSEQVTAAFSKLGESLAPLLADSNDPSFLAAMEAARRINLEMELERWRVPEPAAVWLAERWPVDYMPDVLRVRAEDFANDVGARLLSWRCSVGWHRWLEFREDGRQRRGCMYCDRVEDLPCSR